jgi:glycine/D-amino acid oxidase-like deaminating enzyme
MVQWEHLDSSAVEGSPLALDHPRVLEAMESAREVLPALAHVEPEAVRLGVRPVPADGYPIVGFDAAIGNLYHAVTHSGITLAARLALLVTDELTGGDASPLDPYRPDRFAGGGSARPRPASGSPD